jgi:hypothetical protein
MFVFMKSIRRNGDLRLGGIGLMGFKARLKRPILAPIPMILEPPKDTPDADPRNLRVIRGLAGHSTGLP